MLRWVAQITMLWGGHLMSAKVAVVGELMITPMPTKAVRTYDSSLHLMTISTSDGNQSDHSG